MTARGTHDRAHETQSNRQTHMHTTAQGRTCTYRETHACASTAQARPHTSSHAHVHACTSTGTAQMLAHTTTHTRARGLSIAKTHTQHKHTCVNTASSHAHMRSLSVTCIRAGTPALWLARTSTDTEPHARTHANIIDVHAHIRARPHAGSALNKHVSTRGSHRRLHPHHTHTHSTTRTHTRFTTYAHTRCSQNIHMHTCAHELRHEHTHARDHVQHT